MSDNISDKLVQVVYGVVTGNKLVPSLWGGQYIGCSFLWDEGDILNFRLSLLLELVFTRFLLKVVSCMLCMI